MLPSDAHAIGKLTLDKEGSSFLGTAFAVSRTIALSAFHCIGDRSKGVIKHQEVYLIFPEDTCVRATVLSFDHLQDFVVLTLLDPVPADLRLVSVTYDTVLREKFWIPGYPTRLPMVERCSVTGDVVDLTASIQVRAGTPLKCKKVTVIQLYCLQSGAGMSLKGISGAPVMLSNGDVAIGIVRWNPPREDDHSLGIGGNIFICPIKFALRKVPAASATIVKRSVDDQVLPTDQPNPIISTNDAVKIFSRVRDVDPYLDLGIPFISLPGALDFKSRRPPYVRRRLADKTIDEKLSVGGRFVLVTGAFKSGKSRLAYEAILRNFPNACLITPQTKSPAKLMMAIESKLSLVKRSVSAVLWLDDLEDYLLEEGLDAHWIRRLLAIAPHLIIVGTLNSEDYERLAISDVRPKNPRTDLIDFAQQIYITDRLDQEEREEAAGLYKDLSDHLNFQLTVGDIFLSIQRIMNRYIHGGTTSPDGLILVRLVIDCKRLGLLSPITEEWLNECYVGYKRWITPTDDHANANFRSAIQWAVTPVAKSISLLVKTITPQGLVAFTVPDVLVHNAWKEDPRIFNRPIIWALALEHSNEMRNDLGRMGIIALRAGNVDIGRLLLNKAVEMGDGQAAYNLGLAFARWKNFDAAKHMYKIAIDLGVASAATNLGKLLHESGDDVNAKVMYEKAASLGDFVAKFNLGAMYYASKDFPAAQKIWEECIAHGDGKAAFFLGYSFEERREMTKAESLYRKSLELGFSHSATHLALVSRDQQKMEEAKQLFLEALKLGDGDAAYLLGRLVQDEQSGLYPTILFVRGAMLRNKRCIENLRKPTS